MNYHKITNYDIANGPGIRVVLWVSGCEHHCKNCHNPETWNVNSGIRFDPEATTKIIECLSKDHISGLTISGGDPLHPANRDSILSLVKSIKLLYPRKSIWLYTGYKYEEIHGLYIMDYIDVLVDGRYVDHIRDLNLPYCGSRNQRVIDVRKSRNNQKIVLWNN